MGEERPDSEQVVKKFYSDGGWSQDEHGVTQDANLFEDLRDVAAEYVSKCRLRVLRHIPESGENILDMASGPIQYEEYLKYSEGFQKRHCVDLSSDALLQAQQKIGDHGRFYNTSFFDIDFENDYFDCSISLHTIYHIDSSRQEEAVRKLLDVTKPGAPVVIVYSNPNAIPSVFLKPVKKLIRKLRKTSPDESSESELYYFTYGNRWWNRFSDVADVKIYPWRSFAARLQKILFPDNVVGRKMFALLYWFEERFPYVSSRLFQYPMIVLVKK